MKFVTFVESAATRAGVLLGDAAGPADIIVDLAHPAMQAALNGTAPQLQAFLDAGLDNIVAGITAHGLPVAAQLFRGDVTLLAPLPAPRRIFGIAHNYHDAVAERGIAAPPEPVLFVKGASTVIAPEQPVILPAGIGGVTYEAELAVVIGRHTVGATKERALESVAAYGCFNDVSASELIKADGHFNRGKNFPTFGPFGPFLASADEIADPHALDVILAVDGRVLQRGSTKDMIFDVAALVSWLSHREPLAPGDVIATGTPAGVAAMHKPPAWLRPGSNLVVTVEGLGRLANPITEGPAFDA
jgi:2,4-diketo-3-deoxy-L-fuconate hydrolase